MTLADDSLNVTIRSQVELMRLGATTQKKVVRLLKKMNRELVSEIAKINPAQPKKKTWRKNRLNQLKKQSKEIIGSSYENIDKTVNNDLYRMAPFQTQGAVRTLNTAIGANIFDVTYTSNQLHTLVNTAIIDGDTIGGWWDTQSLDYRTKFNRAMLQTTNQIARGFLKGDPIAVLIKRVRGIDDISGLLSGGRNLVEGGKRQATALTRTAYMQVASDVRVKTYEQFDDVLKGYQYVATLDKRTTPYCRAADGRLFDVNFKPVNDNFNLRIPPSHWGCRSTINPLTKSWAELSGKNSPLKKDQIQAIDSNTSPGQRASMGGPVKMPTDYNSWLKDQSPKAQKDVLGIKRRELWKKNLLTQTDLVNVDGYPLTIKQLEKQYGPL